jgi:hypothetical protein
VLAWSASAAIALQQHSVLLHQAVPHLLYRKHVSEEISGCESAAIDVGGFFCTSDPIMPAMDEEALASCAVAARERNIVELPNSLTA